MRVAGKSGARLGDPVFTQSRRYGTDRCPVRPFDPSDGGQAALAGLEACSMTTSFFDDPSHEDHLNAERRVSHCYVAVELNALRTGVQAIQLSPYVPCTYPPDLQWLRSLGHFPDMLWSRFPFGISAGLSPAPVSRVCMDYSSYPDDMASLLSIAPPRRTATSSMAAMPPSRIRAVNDVRSGNCVPSPHRPRRTA